MGAVTACGDPSAPPDTGGGDDALDIPPAAVAEHNDYSNPTYPLHKGEKAPLYTADPYVIRGDDGSFYMYCTQTEVYESDDKSYRTFKRGPVFRSENCVDWQYVSDVFASYTPDWGLAEDRENNAGVWAPTVCKVGDYYNFYYSLSWGGGYDDGRIGIGVARSTTPYGPFTHYGKLFTSEEIGVVNSIDPHVLWDDGRLYMVFGSYGGLITLVELEEDGLSLKNGLEYQREHKVALAGYSRYEMKNYEASIIYKRHGKYYLFLSTGTTLSGLNSSYHVVVGVSDDIAGPYRDSAGKNLMGPDRGDYVVVPNGDGAMGVGHMCIVEDDAGEAWMIYHGYDSVENSSYRSLYLDRLVWNSKSLLPRVDGMFATNHTAMPGPYIDALENKEATA